MHNKKKEVLLATASAVLPAVAMLVYVMAAPQSAQAFGSACYYAGQAYSPGAVVMVNQNPPICITCGGSSECTWTKNASGC